jgi:hypothetical protein
MLPLTSRRRARRQTLNRRIAVFGSAVVVTLLVIGGLTQISRNSGPYTAQMNRTFATQVSVLADSSNLTATSVRRLMATLSRQSRQKLQVQLDGAVQQTARQETQASTFALPAPPGAIAQHFSTVFSDRAQAMSEVRAAIDGLLGMHPLPVAGAEPGIGTAVSTPTLLSSTEATNRIAAAGVLLNRSDRDYAAVRGELARADGHARVPSSAWITNDQLWQVGAVATQIDQVEASPSLTAAHQLALTTVRISPPALPSPTGAATPGTSTLSPTNSLGVSVVVSDLGTADEPRATVRITLTAQSGGRTVTLTRVAAIAAGRSVTLSPAIFGVKPGKSYQLSVDLAVPPAQASTANTTETVLLQIAPTTPPTTTTTTPPTTTTSKPVRTTTTTSAK